MVDGASNSCSRLMFNNDIMCDPLYIGLTGSECNQRRRYGKMSSSSGPGPGRPSPGGGVSEDISDGFKIVCLSQISLRLTKLAHAQYTGFRVNR